MREYQFKAIDQVGIKFGSNQRHFILNQKPASNGQVELT